MIRHRTHLLVAWLLVLALAGTSGCSQAETEVHAAGEIDARLIESGLDFGLSLHRAVAGLEPGENVFMSPASVAMALHMTLNGADGDTRDAMVRALSLGDMSIEDLNRANSDLLTLFTATIPGIDIAMANSLWAREGVGFRSEFLGVNEEFYRATTETLDFDRPEALDTINGWVERETRGMIDGIVETIDPDAVLFLINALYFEGEWSEQFDPALTIDFPFTSGDGSEITVPMMRMSEDLGYLQGEGFQAVRLPYGNGRMSMYVFLPSEEMGLDGFLDGLAADEWNSWMEAFSSMRVDLGLPRFEVEFKADLADALKAMGMDIAFSQDAADFSGMRPIPPRLFINSVSHRAVVEVNEEGTEAAAATAVEIGILSMPVSVPMVVDRPFFFAIRDDLTGALLFTGSVSTP